ncbi:neuronal acetylcholine receptor subunit alpha-6-like [Dreissena polymorpha]|uniref:neuronal acetylcholine receptor subunit alpha-6-like n=1 Tax=Dreissena polymorpha TaxID=45954 RepID=UPI0022651C3A|nr:neuronal acetylcholine receptor subunit alpha-6-like [Dreissena polymorpha]
MPISARYWLDDGISAEVYRCWADIGPTLSLNDTKTLLRDLLSNYNKNVRPVHNQSEIVNVTVKLYVKSIQEFNQLASEFKFKLKRRPAYVLVNVLLPILFLSVLNLLVFLLVPESGERVSYCITVLLSIVVFMTIVSAMLPRTSKPVPIVSYKLIVDMVISAAITVVSILNLRIYSKDPEIPVPKWLIGIYRFWACAVCRKQKTKLIWMRKLFRKTSKATRIQTVKTISEAENENDIKRRLSEFQLMDEEQITRKKISYMVEVFAFWLFGLATLCSFAVFLAIVTSRGK